MGDSEDLKTNNNSSEDFDIGTELSTLVAENVIPSKIAEKLEKKLKEKKIKLNREQFNVLIEKITSIMRTYSKFDLAEKEDKGKQMQTQPLEIKTDTNMQKLVETIEKLEERIANIETEVLGKEDKQGETDTPKIVTTEDIKVPGEDTSVSNKEWRVDPLTEIPNDPESVIIIMKWLQYLIDRCGRKNLSNILDYYVDIGWITQDVKINLIDYSQGITEETKKSENTRVRDAAELPSRDHIQSLIFIQKLKGRELDRHFIERIDSEINRITKKLDNYQFK
ncbi:MAG: hypothetical protein DRM98_01065 [Thermoplasmata archaeon]|nr:MAG: hypothetical protein DRM98_01065 [Thermoplasmata archaeon]RLF51635.1 MAG: hypothetical protein DRN24_04610 [Thermoplasmata archaeon]